MFHRRVPFTFLGFMLKQDPVSTTQKTGWTIHSSFPVLFGLEKGFTLDVISRRQSTTIFLCFGPFSTWWKPNERTNNQVILVQACSWLVRRLSFAKKENICRPTNRCPAFVSHLNMLKVILSHTQTIWFCHIWTPELFFLSHLNTWNLLLSQENAQSVILCEMWRATSLYKCCGSKTGADSWQFA